uniref:BBF2H7/FUS protein n=1 Tax=Homo sapiens TaxID=9606 RepID=Q70T19_HUMAN|nr:BBF2H7/FUS protein [Homo sapiens]
MEVLESGEQGVLQWDRKLSELSEPGDGEALMYHTALGTKDHVMTPNRIIQTTTPSLCKAWVRMLQLSLWLITSSRLVLLRQTRKRDSP